MRKTENKIVSKIPIFITVRGNTKEIYERNKECLKFSYIFIKQIDLFKQTFIISDNEHMLTYAKELGFLNTIHYACGSEKDLKYLEYLATYRYGVEKNYKPDWIILLNVNQIFKFTSLLVDCINNIDDNYDVIASYTEISNKSHFFIDSTNNIVQKDKRKLSSEYDRQRMCDSVIYAIKSKFAFECMEFDDPSEHFWNGNIKYFKNNSLYTDIYDIEDIKKYYKIWDIIEDVKKIKK